MEYSKRVRIANLAMNCAYCRPLSGCLMSDLKCKQKAEILASLDGLTEAGLDRLISFHESCSFRHNLPI